MGGRKQRSVLGELENMFLEMKRNHEEVLARLDEQDKFLAKYFRNRKMVNQSPANSNANARLGTVNSKGIKTARYSNLNRRSALLDSSDEDSDEGSDESSSEDERPNMGATEMKAMLARIDALEKANKILESKISILSNILALRRNDTEHVKKAETTKIGTQNDPALGGFNAIDPKFFEKREVPGVTTPRDAIPNTPTRSSNTEKTTPLFGGFTNAPVTPIFTPEAFKKLTPLEEKLEEIKRGVQGEAMTEALIDEMIKVRKRYKAENDDLFNIRHHAKKELNEQFLKYCEDRKHVATAPNDKLFNKQTVRNFILTEQKAFEEQAKLEEKIHETRSEMDTINEMYLKTHVEKNKSYYKDGGPGQRYFHDGEIVVNLGMGFGNANYVQSNNAPPFKF
jgi:hypothetical protein